MATLAIFRPRRIARWKYLLRHSGSLRTVTCAASTSRKRSSELPCFVMWPSRRRLPAGVFQWHQSEITRDLLAALKPVWSADDQHEGQRRQCTYTGMCLQSLRLRTLLHLLLDGLCQPCNCLLYTSDAADE